MKRKLSGIFAGKSRVVVKIFKVLLACIAVANLIWLFPFQLRACRPAFVNRTQISGNCILVRGI